MRSAPKSDSKVGHKARVGAFITVAFALLSGWAAGSAQAASVLRVGVPAFSGPGARKVQSAVSKVIRSHGLKVISDAEIKRAAKRLHVSVGSEEGAQLVSVKLHLTMIVAGRITVQRKVLTLHLTVRDGDGGLVGDESTWSARSPAALASMVGKKMWRDLGQVLRGRSSGDTARTKAVEQIPEVSTGDDLPTSKSSAEKESNSRQGIDEVFPDAPGRRATTNERAQAEPAAEAEVPPPRRERVPPTAVRRRRALDEAASAPTENGPAKLELAVGPRMLLRQLTYGSDPDDALTPFGTRQPGAAIGGSALWVPHLGTPRLGFGVEGEYASNMKATSDNDLEYKVAAADYLASVLIGLSTGSVTADLVLSGGRQWFAFIPQGIARTRPRLVPDVMYDYARAGLAVRFYTSGALTLLAAAYYRYIINAGAIRTRDWFPSAKVWGFQGSLGASYRILPWWEARLEADVRSYQFTMDPTAGDARTTASARDQYLTVWLSMVLRFGGEKR